MPRTPGPQWSPLGMSGNTADGEDHDPAGEPAAMEPARDEREYPAARRRADAQLSAAMEPARDEREYRRGDPRNRRGPLGRNGARSG